MSGSDSRYADAPATPEEQAAAEQARRDYRDRIRHGAPVRNIKPTPEAVAALGAWPTPDTTT
jgi:hypothetical protein